MKQLSPKYDLGMQDLNMHTWCSLYGLGNFLWCHTSTPSPILWSECQLWEQWVDHTNLEIKLTFVCKVEVGVKLLTCWLGCVTWYQVLSCIFVLCIQDWVPRMILPSTQSRCTRYSWYSIAASCGRWSITFDIKPKDRFDLAYYYLKNLFMYVCNWQK